MCERRPLCRDDARTTAAVLVDIAAAGSRSRAAADALAALLGDVDSGDPRADYLALAGGIAALTTAASGDAASTCRACVNAAVLAFSIRQNRRERVWFKDAGFDPDPAELPDLASLCAANPRS